MRSNATEIRANQIRIQGIGWVPAKPAREFQVGEYRLYNYGHVGRIVHIEPKGTNSVSWVIEEGGKLYPGIVRANTMFAIGKADNYNAY